jgi:RNA ligase
MRLDDLLNRELLADHVANRLVAVQPHPVLPLWIYNYTQHAQFDPHWGDGTIDYCRGLIVGPDDEIISRPFKKFHNLNTESIPETMEANLPTMEPTVTQKLDGSLGIHYAYDGFEGIATRGSFTSPQAQWATAWYNKIKAGRKLNFNKEFVWPKGLTPLFEIIYSENRIVVKYDYEALVLIGLVGVQSGYEAPHAMLRDVGHKNELPVVRAFRNLPLAQLKSMNIENEEGYVLSYTNFVGEPLKVKVKMVDYVRLHRVVTGMNARSVWELMKAGDEIDKFETGYPEHFTNWLHKWKEKLQQEFIKVSSVALDIFVGRPLKVEGETNREYRKACALYFLAQPRQDVKSLFFMLLDEKDTAQFMAAVWDMIEPRGDDKTFREEGQ